MAFENIFSERNSPKKKQKPKIIIDLHEKNSLVPSSLVNLDCNIEFKHLQVADYLVNGVAIERKTISDLKTSIISKRILFQIKELKQYPKCLLIIEGTENFPLYEGIIHENALRGFILSVLLEQQIPIVFTEDEEDTAKYLSILAKKTKETTLSLRTKIPLNSKEQAQFILEGFPGIGPANAKKLLKKFKSLKNIFKASKEELSKVIGEKLADSMHKELD